MAAEIAARPHLAPCGRCPCDDQGRQPIKAWHIPGVLKTDRCPRYWLPADVWEWIRLYDHYRAGYLPFAGGILDQPAVFEQAMRLIGNRITSTLEEQTKHDKSKGRR